MNPTRSFSPTRSAAQALDTADELAPFRRRFHLPRPQRDAEAARQPVVYLCGHSLGLQPRHAADLVGEVLTDWQRLAVDAHFDAGRPWYSYHEQVTGGLARVAGCQPDEVVAMNSLTANLHLMMAGFYRPDGARHRILIESGAFPSDRYAVDSQLRWRGLDPATARLDIAPREGEHALRTDDIVATIDRHADTLALVLLPGVQYLSGQLLDIAAIARTCRRHGIVFGVDAAHAIGNVALRLHDWDVDFAVWCSYKYLNAGPGAVAGCFVHARHARRTPALAGWWGHDKRRRFRMAPDFDPIPGAEGWQLSNPSVLALAPLIASLELFDEAGIRRLAAKSRRLTGYLEYLLTEWLPREVEILTPAERGAQLSVRLRVEPARAHAAFERLRAAGIVADWRAPDVIRMAPVPLYNRFQDAWLAADALTRVLGTGRTGG